MEYLSHIILVTFATWQYGQDLVDDVIQIDYFSFKEIAGALITNVNVFFPINIYCLAVFHEILLSRVDLK